MLLVQLKRAAAAQTIARRRQDSSGRQRLSRPHASLLVAVAWIVASLTSPLAAAAQHLPNDATSPPLISIVVELDAPPAAQFYADRLRAQKAVDRHLLASATQAYVANLERAQQSLLAELTRLDAQILYRTQRVYNGIALRIAPDRLHEIAQLPGVKAVHSLIAKTPTNATSVPYIGAPVLWSSPVSATGEGITIAIIDTGVDYLHPDFGGPDTDYGANDPTIIGDVAGFPGVKIIGGYDFVGDNYNSDPAASNYQPIPQPDPDPTDCYSQGHGTHVAGSAAGFGVTSTGATYSGPYDGSTDFASLRIGPGVAPNAQIYALKVFGCSGHSEIVDQAIEWVVDPNGDGDFSDRVDVINMSLGSTYGALDDPTTVAAENAAHIGVIVVASAGNSGDTYYTVGSPSVADHVISVAASTEVAVLAGDAERDARPNDTLASFSSRGPRRIDSAIKPDLAAPGVSIFSARRSAGALGYASSGTSMAAPHVAGSMALLREIFPRHAAGGQTAGTEGALWSAADLKALAMNTAMREIHTSDQSDSPVYAPARIGSGRIDLAAALSSQVIAYSGDDPGRVSISFGAPDVLVGLQATKNLRIENKGSLTATYAISYSSVAALPGVEFSFPGPNPVTVAPASIVNVPIVMTADAGQMKHTRDPTVDGAQIYPRQWLSEESGYIVLMSTGAPNAHRRVDETTTATLHVPIHAAPRPAAQMVVANHALEVGTAITSQQSITLTGIDLRGTDHPTDVVSLASFFELHLSSPPDNQTAFGHADLKFVGVSCDLIPARAALGAAESIDEATIYFAIATHGEWSTPNEVEFGIHIDPDEDGVSEFRLFNADQRGFPTGASAVSDAFVTVLEDLTVNPHTRTSQEFLNVLSAARFDTAIFNSDVLILPVQAAALGLHAANTDFDYYVESYSNDVSYSTILGTYVERTPRMSYDVALPGLVAADGAWGAPIHEDFDGTNVEIGTNRLGYRGAGADGLLVLHHHNIGSRRAERVPVLGEWPYELYLPIINKE